MAKVIDADDSQANLLTKLSAMVVGGAVVAGAGLFVGGRGGNAAVTGQLLLGLGLGFGMVPMVIAFPMVNGR